MNVNGIPPKVMDNSDDEFGVLEGMNIDIPECEGLPCWLWNTKCVTLYNEEGVLVGEGTCHSVNSDLVLGATGPLGDSHVVVFVATMHSQKHLPEERIYSLVAWPIKYVHYRGTSLQDHEARDNFNRIQATLLNPPSSTSTRSYTSTMRNPPCQTSVKSKALLTQESINAVSSKSCCSQNCVQPFPREKIRAFRERMYYNSTFKHTAFKKTEVTRQVHRDAHGQRMVTLDEIPVCMRAWMHISGVPESTFYRYQMYMNDSQEALDHGNRGLLKPRKHTLQAAASLKCILEKQADHMPHRTRTLKIGEKVVSMCLPATFQWKNQIKELNEVNAAFGLKEVSTSNLSKIRASKFSEYEVKKPRDNFAWCATCDTLQALKRASLAGSITNLKWNRKLDKHLAVARAHRDYYYINRYKSHNFPHECLTVMHDKMDHSKTDSPIFSHKSKELDGLVKLPVSITSMIAHGHGDVRYAHYGLDMFARDSNYTISSVAKLLRDLELPPKSSSRELFVGSGPTNLFKAILKGVDICKASLPPLPEVLVPTTPLPPILNVQMDNATGDNKNKYVFGFWSLLVAKKIFREVYVNFMIVGHTHDDIDALFGRWSMALKKESFPTIPLLMKSFMDVESIPTIPHLIEEVADFKGFIEGSLKDGNDILVGHTKPQQVKFYLDSIGCLVMMYKMLCTDADWLGENGRGIKLWKEDAEGRSLCPRGSPLLVPQNAMNDVQNMVKGISGFIKYWEKLCNADVTGESRMRYEHLVHYWRDVKIALEEPLPNSTILKDGFWPTTRIQATQEDQLDEDGKNLEEFDEDDAYVGPLRNHPRPSFRVARDVFEGYFVVIRPADGDSHPVWIGRALSNPNSSPENPNCILIQYFRPTSRN